MTNQSIAPLLATIKIAVLVVLASILSIAIGTALAGSESSLTPNVSSDAGTYGYYSAN